MVSSSSDAIHHISDSKIKMIAKPQVTTIAEKMDRIKIKPFYMLLVMYAVIAAIGIVYNINN